jgi:hypothetical protein
MTTLAIPAHRTPSPLDFPGPPFPPPAFTSRAIPSHPDSPRQVDRPGRLVPARAVPSPALLDCPFHSCTSRSDPHRLSVPPRFVPSHLHPEPDIPAQLTAGLPASSPAMSDRPCLASTPRPASTSLVTPSLSRPVQLRQPNPRLPALNPCHSRLTNPAPRQPPHADWSTLHAPSRPYPTTQAISALLNPDPTTQSRPPHHFPCRLPRATQHSAHLSSPPPTSPACAARRSPSRLPCPSRRRPSPVRPPSPSRRAPRLPDYPVPPTATATPCRLPKPIPLPARSDKPSQHTPRLPDPYRLPCPRPSSPPRPTTRLIPTPGLPCSDRPSLPAAPLPDPTLPTPTTRSRPPRSGPARLPSPRHAWPCQPSPVPTTRPSSPRSNPAPTCLASPLPSASPPTALPASRLPTTFRLT